MTTSVLANEVTARASALPTAVAELAGCSFAALADDELLDVLRLAERARRQLEALDHVLIAELEARNLPGRHVLRGSKQLLAGLLTLSPAESGTRVRHAHELGPRTSLIGEPLPPLLPVAAAARGEGAITGRQVEVIISAMTRLRAAQLPVDQQAAAEAFLVEQARRFDATILAGIARRLLDTLDPDGRLVEKRSQQRRRFLSCVPNGDGMHRLTADLDAETAALAMTVLHSLAAPKPSANGEPDQRTVTVRLTRGVYHLEERHIALARAVSTVAQSHGAVCDRSAAQEVQVAIAAQPDALDVRFWRAVLGYLPLGDDNAVDPLGHGSTVWMQQLDPNKPLRHAMHVDVSLAREQAAARVAAALEAGGRLVDQTHDPASWILADRAGNKVCIAAWPDGG